MGGKRPASAKPAPSVVYVEVTDEQAGRRLDNFILAQIKGVPKSHVYRIIRSGEVRVNSKRAKADSRLASGDKVRLPPLRQATRRKGEPDAELVKQVQAAVIYEDENIIALNKPRWLGSHGGVNRPFGVIEVMQHLHGSKEIYLAHRLDLETTGVLLVARRLEVLRQIGKVWHEENCHKLYLALVRGRWADKNKIIRSHISKSKTGGQFLMRSAGGGDGSGGAGYGVRAGSAGGGDDSRGAGYGVRAGSAGGGGGSGGAGYGVRAGSAGVSSGKSAGGDGSGSAGYGVRAGSVNVVSSGNSAGGDRSGGTNDDGKLAITKFSLLKNLKARAADVRGAGRVGAKPARSRRGRGPNAGADEFSLLQVELLTGKTHQIRIQCAGEGHPVVGDSKYSFMAGVRANKGEELALHCHKIELPLADKKYKIVAPPPDIFPAVKVKA